MAKKDSSGAKAHKVRKEYENAIPRSPKRVIDDVNVLVGAYTDTNYIVKPKYNWQVKLIGNMMGNNLGFKGEYGQAHYSIHASSGIAGAIGAGIGWKGLQVAASVNPAKLAGKSSNTEININAYANRFGLDVVYNHAKSYSGKSHVEIPTLDPPVDVVTPLPKGSLGQQMILLSAYYAFNWRKFSMPAAFAQSQIQRKGAGSLMIGASFHYTQFTIDISETFEAARNSYLDKYFVAVGVGYGYNFVYKNWVFHLSDIPQFALYSRDKLSYYHSELQATVSDDMASFFNIFNVARVAITYNFSRFFLSATMVCMNTFALNSGKQYSDSAKYRARLMFGVRF